MCIFRLLICCEKAFEKLEIDGKCCVRIDRYYGSSIGLKR